MTALALACLATQAAVAADAHRAVQPKPGEIVLLRNVATRPAYREAPPGMALIVNPSPRHELDAALGVGELSDEDYASLGASPTDPSPRPTTVEAMVGRALGPGTGSGGTARADGGAAGLGPALSVPLGAVGGATRGIGNQVQGALSALPGLTAAPGNGH